MTDVLTYVLQFRRPPKKPGGEEPPTTASGLRVTTLLEDGMISARLEPVQGDLAVLDLHFRLNYDETLFFESGTVAFGSDPGASTLAFSSVGTGSVLGTPAADGFSHGVVMWAIDSGTGALAGATGAITSNFLVNLQTEELIDNHLGVVPPPPIQGVTE